MSQEQIGIKRMSSIGVIAAFGVLTMSSSNASHSITTMNSGPDYYYESYNYVNNENNVCNSSMLLRHVVGDIVSVDNKTDFVQQHEKMKVELQITKITSHISSFEFEEEYEEI